MWEHCSPANLSLKPLAINLNHLGVITPLYLSALSPPLRHGIDHSSVSRRLMSCINELQVPNIHQIAPSIVSNTSVQHVHAFIMVHLPVILYRVLYRQTEEMRLPMQQFPRTRIDKSKMLMRAYGVVCEESGVR